MVKPQKVGKNVRMSFSKIDEILEMPNLIEVQKNSYQWFLEEGLMEVLRDVSPITDYSGNLFIDFVSYSLDSKPKYPVEECKERDVNYAAPLKVEVRLSNKLTGEVKQSEIFMGDFPLMTDSGTFIINGAERVVVSQIVRSPGIYYDQQIDKTGKRMFTATVIPYRGAWLEYETDSSDVFYVRIDKNRKLPITMLIRALGIQSADEIRAVFGDEPKLVATLEKDECDNLALENKTSVRDEALKEIYKKLRPGEPAIVESAETLINNYFFDPKRYDIAPVGRYKFDKKVAISSRIANHKLAEAAVSPFTGEVVYEAGTVLTPEMALEVERAGVNEVMLELDNGDVMKVLSNNTLEPEYIIGMDLSDCGVKERVRIAVLREIMEAAEGDLDVVKTMVKERIAELCPKHITKDDIFASINYMLNLTHEVGCVDDIDHLGNRRIRSVGEQLQNQLRIGFVRMEKIIKERMTTQDNDKLTPQALINIRPVVAAIKEFFGSSPLSQFMDQNNPLSELTHKRRLSALGPGGLSRERASLDVRDIHYTHYGRMCPIETPEGPNIGLINYLATFAKINEYGFVEAPYRKVDKATGKVTDQVDYMTADVEDDFYIGQANEPLDENGCLANARITCRHRNEIIEVDREVIDYIDRTLYTDHYYYNAIRTKRYEIAKTILNPTPETIINTNAITTADRLRLTAGGVTVETTYVSHDATSITFAHNLDKLKDKGDITIQRIADPDLDFIVAHENRLWGVHGKKIYASKQGDPKVFKTETTTAIDPWNTDVGTDGEWTGIASYSGSLLAFKEHVVHKVLGTLPDNFSAYVYNVEGIKKGCHMSAVILGEVLYYYAQGGVYAYTGATPTLVSANFGVKRFDNAVGGTDGRNLYLSMQDADSEKWELYILDTIRGIWLREDDLQVGNFDLYEGDLYALDMDTGEVLRFGYGNERVRWSVTTGKLFEDTLNRKRYTKAILRADVGDGATLTIETSNDDGDWTPLYQHATAHGKTIVMPILPHRADNFRLKISGEGFVRIRGLAREYKEGSEL